MEIEVPDALMEPLRVPNKTLVGPGPSNYSQRVLDAISNPVLGHLHPECLKIMDDIKKGIKYIFQTKNRATMCISASGHGGLEASLCNILESGDVLLVGVTGIWGHRAAEIASRYGVDVRFCEARYGRCLTLQEIHEAMRKFKPQAFFIAHGDSSTGILQHNIKEIGDLCRKFDCLFVVDVVASIGTTEFYMDEWNVDVAYTGSQKVLGAPPGITPISFSERALKKVESRSSKINVYYWDVNLLGDYWNCFGRPRIYHHTVSSTLLYGLREALATVCQEGLPSLIKRHKLCSLRLQQGIEEMGLEMFVTEPDNRLASINTVKIPKGVDWKTVSEYAMDKYFLEISGGLGPTAEQVFRIGVMGENATVEKVDLIIKILEEALENTSMVVFNKSKI